MKWPLARIAVAAPPERAQVSFNAEDEVWLLSLDQIESQTGRILSKKRIRPAEAGSSTFAFDENHVLYSKLRPYLNKVVRPDEPGLATTELIPLRPRTDLLNAGFLTFYLRSDAFVRFATNMVAGAKMPRIIMDEFWQHELPLPPLSEQRRIVELLEQADALRRRRADADSLSARILPTLFRKMFGDPVRNPKGWPVQRLGFFLEAIESGQSPNCETRAAEDGEWGVLKLGAVTGNYFIDSKNKALPSNLTADPSLEVKPGDLLFSRKNTFDLVGACAFVFETRCKLLMSDLIFRFRFKNDGRLAPLFLWGLLTTDSMRPAIKALAGGSAGSMPNISKARLETLPIPVPPELLQNQFADFVEKLQEPLKNVASTVTNIQMLFQTLLHRAFTAELTAGWREAHMQELLTEMEQQAKALDLFSKGAHV